MPSRPSVIFTPTPGVIAFTRRLVRSRTDGQMGGYRENTMPSTIYRNNGVTCCRTKGKYRCRKLPFPKECFLYRLTCEWHTSRGLLEHFSTNRNRYKWMGNRCNRFFGGRTRFGNPMPSESVMLFPARPHWGVTGRTSEWSIYWTWLTVVFAACHDVRAVNEPKMEQSSLPTLYFTNPRCLLNRST